MSASNTIDTARVELLLSELRLPGVKLMWAKLAAQSAKEGWPAARFLAALAELEVADRVRRCTERHTGEAKLPPGKGIAAFDFAHVPMVSKAQVMALAAGDAWLDKGANVLMFGPPESDSYCSSLDLLIIPALFVADFQTPDAGVGGPQLPG